MPKRKVNRKARKAIRKYQKRQPGSGLTLGGYSLRTRKGRRKSLKSYRRGRLG